MPENEDRPSGAASEGERQTTARQLGLTIVGVVLFGVGIGPVLGPPLYAFARELSWPVEGLGIVGLLLGIVLLSVVPIRVMRAIPKAAVWTIVGIWFLGAGLRGWWWISESVALGQDTRAMLGLMIAVFGLFLIGSNGWDRWIMQRVRDSARKAASCGRAHPKMPLIALFVALWLLNAHNAHVTVAEASRVAEHLGAYRTAIVFASLARDTFPTDTSCGTCFGEIQEELTARIGYLERKSAGQDVDTESPDDRDHTIHQTSLGPSWRANRTTNR